MTSSTRRVDKASRVIHSSAETVYSAFADTDAWVHWLPPTGMTCEIEQFDFHEGGQYRIALLYQDDSIAGKSGDHRDVTTGTFVELIPNHRMVQAVEFESGDPAFAGRMIMTWQLEPMGGDTRVTICAKNVPEGISPQDHAEGMQSTLENLARFVERES